MFNKGSRCHAGRSFLVKPPRPFSTVCPSPGLVELTGLSWCLLFELEPISAWFKGNEREKPKGEPLKISPWATCFNIFTPLLFHQTLSGLQLKLGEQISGDTGKRVCSRTLCEGNHLQALPEKVSSHIPGSPTSLVVCLSIQGHGPFLSKYLNQNGSCQSRRRPETCPLFHQTLGFPWKKIKLARVSPSSRFPSKSKPQILTHRRPTLPPTSSNPSLAGADGRGLGDLRLLQRGTPQRRQDLCGSSPGLERRRASHGGQRSGG